jgi:hypothetical protein
VSWVTQFHDTGIYIFRKFDNYSIQGIRTRVKMGEVRVPLSISSKRERASSRQCYYYRVKPVTEVIASVSDKQVAMP